MLKAAVAKVDITPPVGVRLSGFSGRTLPSLAVHDPLWARALLLDDGANRAALVSLDLIGVSEEAVADVRESVRSSAGIRPEALLVAATHTHSGPRAWDEDANQQEREYWEALPNRLADLIAAAAGSLAPARIGASSGWAAVGVNRRERLPNGYVTLGRNQFGPFDSEVGVVRVDRDNGQPLACVMNYACHAVCLMFDNLLISADYPGYAVHIFEDLLGEGVTGLFFNGACGNVNPREGGVEHGMASGGSFVIAHRAGNAIAEEAVRLWPNIALRDDVSLSFAQRMVELPVNPERALRGAEGSLRESARESEQRQTHFDRYGLWDGSGAQAWAQSHLRAVQARGDSPVRAEIQAISIGPIAFLGWPGEVFCELGMGVKRESPFRPTYVIGYANGSIGYVPVPEAFAEGGYEVQSASHLAENCGVVLVEESIALLKALEE